MSKVHIKPPCGWLSVYTLMADTPVLLGSDLLDSFGANIRYKENMMDLTSVSGEPALQLERLPSGHRLLDLCDLPEPKQASAGPGTE